MLGQIRDILDRAGLRANRWVRTFSLAALAIALVSVLGLGVGCGVGDWFSEQIDDTEDDNVASQPILDIQSDALPEGVSIRIQVHGQAGAAWCLGVRRSDGTFEHATQAKSVDCVSLPLDGQGNGQYALAVTDPRAASVLFIELSSACEVDAGALDAGSTGPICAGSAPVRSRVWPLGASSSDGGRVDASGSER